MDAASLRSSSIVKKKSFALYFNSWTLCYINGVGTESEKLTLSDWLKYAHRNTDIETEDEDTKSVKFRMKTKTLVLSRALFTYGRPRPCEALAFRNALVVNEWCCECPGSNTERTGKRSENNKKERKRKKKKKSDILLGRFNFGAKTL